jgi:6-phosphogluconolactonase
LCAAVNPTTAPHGRITLSKTAVLHSRQIYLHLVGESKLSVYHQALAGDDVSKMPIRAVLEQRKTPVDVFYSA